MVKKERKWYIVYGQEKSKYINIEIKEPKSILYISENVKKKKRKVVVDKLAKIRFQKISNNSGRGRWREERTRKE